MPLQATSGAATYDAFGGGVPYVPTYIEEVFQTWLYTGTGSTLTITNGVDLAGKGGMVWTKSRSNATSNIVFDTAMGGSSILVTDSTSARITTSAPPFLTFNSNGFSFNKSAGGINQSPDTYASWTFREQPKFFDVVTWTGDGATFRDIPHNLQSVPGCVMIKRTDGISNWNVWHRSLGPTFGLRLNTTDEATDNIFADPFATSTSFQALGFNDTGRTFVAYLFAHNAGGFGLTGTDNVISCGSYTGNGSSTGPVINLGYEPQWLLVKQSSIAGANWVMLDTMRGFTASGSDAILYSNSSNAEATASPRMAVTSTGFQPLFSGYEFNQSGQTYIYIAIRRGPMRVPTTGTSVFTPVFASGTAGTVQTTNFPVDAQILRYPQSGFSNFFVDRLRGVSTTPANQASPYILTDNTQFETTGPNLTYGWSNTGFAISASFNNLQTIFWNFRRAPGFFDEVCYRGSGTTQDLKHNLQVPPELLIFKDRSNSSDWDTYYPVPGQAFFYDMKLNTLATPTNRDYSNVNSRMRAAPDSTTVFLNTSNFPNNTGANLVCYLFATCPGVSKVGIVEATGSLQTVNCGFTSGARFVMIKSISNSSNSAYGWRVYDSARGITSGNDPVLYLNSTEGESNTQNSIGVVSSGFQITGSDPYLSSGSFIFLAIA